MAEDTAHREAWSGADLDHHGCGSGSGRLAGHRDCLRRCRMAGVSRIRGRWPEAQQDGIGRTDHAQTNWNYDTIRVRAFSAAEPESRKGPACVSTAATISSFCSGDTARCSQGPSGDGHAWQQAANDPGPRRSSDRPPDRQEDVGPAISSGRTGGAQPPGLNPQDD